MQRAVLAVAALLLAVGTLSVQPALAQQKGAPPKSPALDQLDCRTLLKLDGDERGYTLVYYHGFVSGRLNQMELPTEQLATATDRIIEHCIDKPNDKVLAVFEQVRKPK
jgi:hypothetical protein